MISRRRILGTMGVLAAVSLQAACGKRRNRGVLRYRITIEVDTPNGLKTGSSVLEAKFPTNGMSEGQSPFVEVARGRFVFVLLSGEGRNLTFVLDNVLKDPNTKPSSIPDDLPYSEYVDANRQKPFGVLKRDYPPMLVTFSDPNKPDSVERVDPENFAAQFGAGYSLRRMTMQVVDQNEPLTEGIDQVLPWLDQYQSVNLKGYKAGATPFPDYTTAAGLNALSFKWRPK